MMESETLPMRAPSQTGADALFRRVLESNPFSLNAVSEANAAIPDVEAIHRRQFDALVGFAQEVYRERGHAGQVVWGEAGIGKSHLLARLAEWARQDNACCVFLHNIQPSPESLPRYVAKCVVHQLVGNRREGLRQMPLFRLVNRALARALEEFPPGVSPPSAQQAFRAYLRYVDRLLSENPNSTPEARAVYVVLFRGLIGAYQGARDGNEQQALLAIRWLSGDDLDRNEASQLALRGSEDAERMLSLPGAPGAESVLLALAELAWLRGQPFLLCFDQVDNLTPEQMRALSQFLHPLIDHGRNLLVVLSGVQRKILDFVEQGAILPAAWERVAQDARGVQLTRITRQEARQLIEKRLEPFLDSYVTLPEVKERLHEDGLFPLGSAWFARQTEGLVEFRPRDAVNWARDRWREVQASIRELGGPAWLARWAEEPVATPPRPLTAEETALLVDEEVARRVDEQIERRRQAPQGLPPDADNLCGLVESLLKAVEGQMAGTVALDRDPRPHGSQTPAYDLCVKRLGRDGRTVATGVTFIATENATSAAASLRRMQSDEAPPDRVLVVCDERMPLRLGAAGERYREQLRRRGLERFAEISLSLGEYAELDALKKVLGDAASGDLEIVLPGGQGRPIGEREALESLVRQQRFARHRLLGTLLG
jgi:hypothetical protein